MKKREKEDISIWSDLFDIEDKYGCNSQEVQDFLEEHKDHKDIAIIKHHVSLCEQYKEFTHLLNTFGPDSEELKKFLKTSMRSPLFMSFVSSKLLERLAKKYASLEDFKDTSCEDFKNTARHIKKERVRERKRRIKFLFISILIVIIVLGLLFIFTRVAHAETSLETTRITTRTYEVVTKYSFNGRPLAMNNRTNSRSFELEEDRLMVFSEYINNFLVILSDNEGRLSSVTVNGEVRNCDSEPNANLCEQSLALARIWRTKLNINEELVGQSRELDPSMQKFLPPAM